MHNHAKNIHTVNPEIKIHTVVSEALDFDHKTAMLVPLGECSDEQLLAEVCRTPTNYCGPFWFMCTIFIRLQGEN